MAAVPDNPRAAGRFMFDILDRVEAAGGDPVDAADEMVKAVSAWLLEFWEGFPEEAADDIDHEDWLLINRAVVFQGRLDQGLPDLGAINDEMEAQASGYVD